jgi:DNA cross-link repair 1A protein
MLSNSFVLRLQYCFPPQPLVITACATLARKTVVGVSPDAPPIPTSHQDGIEVDPEGANERSKKLMQGWLVKKEEGDVKIEEGEGEALKESSVKGKGRTLVVIG